MNKLEQRKGILAPEIQFNFKKLKISTYRLLQNRTGAGRLSKSFHAFMVILIVINIFAVMLETVAEIEEQYRVEFWAFEVFSVAIFTIEYILRLWCCTLNNYFRNPISGRIRFALKPMSIIDMISILPFYIPLILPIDLRMLRVVRLFRIFRIFKLGRYSDAYNLINRVVLQKSEYLAVSLIFVLSLLLVASTIMYFIEHEAQPQVFSSIPSTMWWAIVTLTTVGYGDVYPVTPFGKMLSGTIALLGIGLFALPAGILASGFSEELSRRKIRHMVCPHCGNEINKERL